MKHQDIKELYFKQQKIDERLNNMFQFFNQYPKIIIKAMYDELFFNFIKNEYPNLYNDFYQFFYIQQQNNSFQLTDVKDHIKYTLTKDELYKFLFKIFNQYNQLELRLYNIKKIYPRLKEKNNIYF